VSPTTATVKLISFSLKYPSTVAQSYSVDVLSVDKAMVTWRSRDEWRHSTDMDYC